MIEQALIKDPDADLDYGIDWTDWLGDDEIVQSTWAAPDGITADRPGHAGGLTTVWIRGGEVGQAYRVINRIITAAGRTDDRSINLRILQR